MDLLDVAFYGSFGVEPTFNGLDSPGEAVGILLLVGSAGAELRAHRTDTPVTNRANTALLILVATVIKLLLVGILLIASSLFGDSSSPLTGLIRFLTTGLTIVITFFAYGAAKTTAPEPLGTRPAPAPNLSTPVPLRGAVRFKLGPLEPIRLPLPAS